MGRGGAVSAAPSAGEGWYVGRRMTLALAWLTAACLAAVGLLVQALRASLLEPSRYLEALERSGAYEEVPPLLARAAVAGAQVPAELAGPVEELVRQAVSSDWAREQAAPLLAGLFAYLKGEGAELRLVVTTAGLRERAEPVLERFLPPMVADEVRSGLRTLPDQWDLAPLLPVDARERLEAARAVVGVSALIPVVAAGLAALLALVGWLFGERRLGWWLALWPGGCLAVSGLALFLLAAVPVEMPWVARVGAGEVPPPLRAAAQQLLAGAAAAVRGAGLRALAAGAVMLALGTALEGISARWRPRSPNDGAK